MASPGPSFSLVRAPEMLTAMPPSSLRQRMKRSPKTRVFGDRFIRCTSEDGGMAVNISGARTKETLGPGDASAHHGLEHFGFDTEDIEADIRRLEGLGARLLEGPIQNPNGPRIAFLKAPDDVRVELVERRKIAGGSGCGC